MSSDSTSSSPARSVLKRDSLDLSITAEISPPASKKQRKVALEEKENASRVASKTNYDIFPAQTTPRPDGKGRKYADLSSVSSLTKQWFLHLLNLQ